MCWNKNKYGFFSLKYLPPASWYPCKRILSIKLVIGRGMQAMSCVPPREEGSLDKMEQQLCCVILSALFLESDNAFCIITTLVVYRIKYWISMQSNYDVYFYEMIFTYPSTLNVRSGKTIAILTHAPTLTWSIWAGINLGFNARKKINKPVGLYLKVYCQRSYACIVLNVKCMVTTR